MVKYCWFFWNSQRKINHLFTHSTNAYWALKTSKRALQACETKASNTVPDLPSFPLKHTQPTLAHTLDGNISAPGILVNDLPQWKRIYFSLLKKWKLLEAKYQRLRRQFWDISLNFPGSGWGGAEHRIFQGPVGGKRLQDRTVSITLLT